MNASIQTHTAPSAVLVSSGALEVKLATTFAEIDAAMRLRFEVFNLEMKKGLPSSYDKGYDADAYDAYCDHLIVVDTNFKQVVGAYRLLRQSQAERQIGFYSETEFDLTNLKRLPGESMELGRSCIAASHRTFGVINLLWTAISRYAAQNGIDYLFGCGSLYCSEIDVVQSIYSYLRARHYAPQRYRVWPLASRRMAIEEEAAEAGDPRIIQRRLTPIIKGYLRAGAMICGAPAFDAEFGTVDVLVLMELSRMSHRYQHHYHRAGVGAPHLRGVHLNG